MALPCSHLGNPENKGGWRAPVPGATRGSDPTEWLTNPQPASIRLWPCSWWSICRDKCTLQEA